VPLVSDLIGLYRFAAGLKPFLRETLSIEAARAIVRHGMENRDATFLQKLERAVFGYARSPYRALLQNAGCELGDVATLVKRDGIEGTLRHLQGDGVYVSWDEFKGRVPAVRGSRTFHFRDTDFDNPLLTTHFRSSSGGTRGRPTRIRVDLEQAAQSAPHWALWFAAHGWLDNPLVFWTPTHSGMAPRYLMAAKFGRRFDKWFADVSSMGTLKDRLVSTSVHALARRAGGFSRPEFVPVHEAARVGEYLVGLVRAGKQPCINTSPSEAVRVCQAMQARGISLENVFFLLGAEPLTPARKRTIEAAGARAVPTYGFSEGGNVGSQCPHPGPVDDIHVSLDAYAVIQRTRTLADEQAVGAFLLTALRPACPKVLFNTEIGDYGILEERRCGCLFDDLGYVQHLHTIRSFEKLTGVGVTFLGGDLFHIMEEVLPRKFGGTVTDYQLGEGQDASGFPRYTLLVSPEVGPLDDAALISTLLVELGRLKHHYRFMADLWAQADILQVKRSRPVPTARGKVLPFRTLGSR
jgi:hypothetical protein